MSINHYCETSFLSELPTKNGKIDWKSCIGETITVEYEKCSYELYIEDYNISAHMLKIRNDNVVYDVYTDDLLHGRFHKIFNRLPFSHPELIKFIDGGIDVAKRYASRSEKDIKISCPLCGYRESLRVKSFVRSGYPHCGCYNGSMSYPNKFMFHLLKRLNIGFIREFKAEYDSKTYYFDFYIPGTNLIIEMDGGQHKNDKQKEIDIIKNMYAISNNFQMIRIDCDYKHLDRFEFIKSKVQEMLPFDLSNVDWLDIKKSMTNSIYAECIDMYKHGTYTTGDIARRLEVSMDIVRAALKYGNEIGIIEYNSKIGLDIRNKKYKPKGCPVGTVSKKRRCVNQYGLDGKYIRTFESITDAKKCGFHISRCLNGTNKTAGGYMWKYADDVNGEQSIKSFEK